MKYEVKKKIRWGFIGCGEATEKIAIGIKSKALRVFTNQAQSRCNILQWLRKQTVDKTLFGFRAVIQAEA